MSPSNGTLLSNCKSTSYLQRNRVKRSMFASKTDFDVSNDNINLKRKKISVNSQIDINHAVQTTSNGYMTRNRLKKELTKDNEIDLNVKNKKSKIDKPTNNSGKVKKIKKPATTTFKRKLQLGYVFTRDILSPYPEHYQAIQYKKKNTPSLFESDSESEVDYFQIHNNTNEVESKSMSIFESKLISPTFHKNSGVRTYFNKKSYFNNKLNITSPKIVKTNFKIENSSNLSNQIIKFNENINDLSESSSLETINSITKNNSNEEPMIVTEEFIRHLEQELRMENTDCTQDNIVGDECSISSSGSSLEQNIDVNELVDSKPLSFETNRVTENNLSSIFDIPIINNKLIKKEANLNLNCITENSISYPTSRSPMKNIEVYNLLSNSFENEASDQSIDDHLNQINIPEKNNCHISQINEFQALNLPNFVTHKNLNFINKNDGKRKFETLISEVENDDLNCLIKSSSKKSKNEQFNSKCHCKHFYSFNKNANKILTSKTNHFVFNTNAEKCRQKVLHQKYLEANILKMLINEDNKNIIKLEKLTPPSNSILNNINYEKEVHVKDNDHIEPNILNMLKDVYVDFEYVSEYCEDNKNDTSLELQLIDKNVHTSKNKPIDMLYLAKNDNIAAKNESTLTFIMPYEENYQDSGEKNYCSSDNTSNITTVNMTPTHIAPNEEINMNSNDQKKSKPINITNSIKSDNFKSCLQSNEKFSKHQIDNNDNTSNISTVNMTPMYIAPNEEINMDSNEQKKSKTINNINSIKSDNFKSCLQSNEKFSKHQIDNNDNTSNISTVNMTPMHLTPNEEINMDSNEQKKNESYLNTHLTQGSDNGLLCHNIKTTIVNTSSSFFESPNKKEIDYDFQNSTTEQKEFNKDNIFCDSNTNLNTNYVNNIEYNCMYNNTDQTYDIQIEDLKYNPNTDIKPFNFCSTSNSTILMNENYEEYGNSKPFQNRPKKCNITFIETKITNGIKEEEKSIPLSVESNIQENVFKLPEPPVYKNFFDKNNCKLSVINDQNVTFPELQHKSEQSNSSLFNLINNDIEDSLSNSSSDDDTKLRIEDNEDNIDCKVHKSSTLVDYIDNLKGSIVKDYLPTINYYTTDIESCEVKLINLKKEQSTKIKIGNDDEEKCMKPIVFNEETDLSNNKCENLHILKEENNYLGNCMFMTIEMCNDFYRNKSLNNNTTNTNTFFSNEIKDILKEMYVDEMFISLCQHMVEIYVDEPFFQKFSKIINNQIDKEVNDIETINDESKVYPAFNKSILSTTAAIISKTDVNNSYQENNDSSVSVKKAKDSNSPKKAKNVKSNMKIRIIFRNLINSDKMLNEIFESKEFRNLRFFSEEEIASSIGVFIFEQTFDPPIITGLSAYKVNYDQLNDEVKNKELGSVNLSIICPQIMKLTTITLALVKMLRSNKLIDLILHVIRKNLLNKKMNYNHITTIDHQIITQTVYFVDICVRLGLLKTLQTFIFDSMVLLSNKYCCIIFTSLLLWKNCLPRCVNNEIDPVIITVMSYLIAKKKNFSEQTVGPDIFQRELINLLSFHFNYSFDTDIPYNFVQHIHKPDFFISIVMFLKCCNPKDSVEFMINCLFPIVEDYLNSKQNETNAIKLMDSLYLAIQPFKITCNSTVATYLKKCKGTIYGTKKDEKEHIYNTTYNSYKTMQCKFVEYLHDTRPRSQSFEESLVSIIMVLGSVDYVTSCVSLMKWNPKFEPSTILCKKINMFKSIIGHHLWNKLCVIDNTDIIKCLVNSCLLKKDVYNTILQIYFI